MCLPGLARYLAILLSPNYIQYTVFFTRHLSRVNSGIMVLLKSDRRQMLGYGEKNLRGSQTLYTNYFKIKP